MAQAVGGRYGIPHGASNALCLPPAMRFNARVVPWAMTAVPVERVEELARLAGFERLRDLGVPEDELDELGAAAVGAARGEGEPAARERRRDHRVVPLGLVAAPARVLPTAIWQASDHCPEPMPEPDQPQRRASRATYVVAALIFALALVLAALGVDEKPGRLSDWQALVLGIVQGATELLPDLLVGASDPRPVGRRLDLPVEPRVVQQDLRRRAAPRHADRRRRLLLVGHPPLPRRSAPLAERGSAIETPDERIAWAIARRHDPGGIAGALGESFIEKKLGDPWQIAITLAVFGVLLYLVDQPSPRSATSKTCGSRAAS